VVQRAFKEFGDYCDDVDVHDKSKVKSKKSKIEFLDFDF
jgi:hypothetical protein